MFWWSARESNPTDILIASEVTTPRSPEPQILEDPTGVEPIPSLLQSVALPDYAKGLLFVSPSV